MSKELPSEYLNLNREEALKLIEALNEEERELKKLVATKPPPPIVGRWWTSKYQPTEFIYLLEEPQTRYSYSNRPIHYLSINIPQTGRDQNYFTCLSRSSSFSRPDFTGRSPKYTEVRRGDVLHKLSKVEGPFKKIALELKRMVEEL